MSEIHETIDYILRQYRVQSDPTEMESVEYDISMVKEYIKRLESVLAECKQKADEAVKIVVYGKIKTYDLLVGQSGYRLSLAEDKTTELEVLLRSISARANLAVKEGEHND